MVKRVSQPPRSCGRQRNNRPTYRDEQSWRDRLSAIGLRLHDGSTAPPDHVPGPGDARDRSRARIISKTSEETIQYDPRSGGSELCDGHAGANRHGACRSVRIAILLTHVLEPSIGSPLTIAGAQIDPNVGKPQRDPQPIEGQVPTRVEPEFCSPTATLPTKSPGSHNNAKPASS